MKYVQMTQRFTSKRLNVLRPNGSIMLEGRREEKSYELQEKDN